MLLLLFVQVQQFFSHITTVSGCDQELNVHFYSAASLKYHDSDTWHDTTSSHNILTLGRPVLALTGKSEVPSEEQQVPFLTTLICRSPRSNTWPPVPRSEHSTDWPTRADNQEWTNNDTDKPQPTTGTTSDAVWAMSCDYGTFRPP